jgi:glycosyltransferase involved in cell wall biosynthesis
VNIVFVSHRPFGSFVESGFRQRVGRILYHFLQTDRVRRVLYVWWNDEPRGEARELGASPPEFGKVALFEARRRGFPLARRFGISHLFEPPRVAKACQLLQPLLEGPTWVWATDPRISPAMRRLADGLGARLAYDLIDNFAVRDWLGEKQMRAYREGYQNVVATGDRIVSNNPGLLDIVAIPDAKVLCVRNGVDWDRFHDSHGMPEPADIADIRHPRVGFVGILSEQTDATLLNEVAGKVPECEVVCIGSVARTNVPLNPRIHCLGMKSYNEVPAYVGSLDVGLSIYRDQSSHFNDPQKVYEYLAAGKPVVITDALDSVMASHPVRVAADSSEFVEQVRAALSDPNGGPAREARSQSVKACDWKKRLGEILNFLEKEQP